MDLLWAKEHTNGRTAGRASGLAAHKLESGRDDRQTAKRAGRGAGATPEFRTKNQNT